MKRCRVGMASMIMPAAGLLFCWRKGRATASLHRASGPYARRYDRVAAGHSKFVMAITALFLQMLIRTRPDLPERAYLLILDYPDYSHR